MALQALLDTLEGVDDALKPFYAEADGKFALQVQGIDAHPEIASLKNAYERTKADKAANATKVSDLEKRIKELSASAPDTAATQAQMQSLQDQIAAITGERDTLSGKLLGVTRDRALADALQSSGVTNPTFLKAAQAMLAGMVKVDGDTAIVETAMGPKLLGDFVKGWAASDGKDFVTPPAGGGARGNGQGAADRTMTRAEFEKLDPAAQQKAVMTDKIKIV